MFAQIVFTPQKRSNRGERALWLGEVSRGGNTHTHARTVEKTVSLVCTLVPTVRTGARMQAHRKGTWPTISQNIIVSTVTVIQPHLLECLYIIVIIITLIQPHWCQVHMRNM